MRAGTAAAPFSPTPLKKDDALALSPPLRTLDVIRFSAASTTPSRARTPTAAPALEMASMAYST